MESILFITRSQYGYNTDYFYYSKYLAKEYKVTVLCINEGKPYKHQNNVNVYYINKRKYVDLILYLIESIKKIKILSPDFVIVNTFPFAFILPIFFKKPRMILDIRSGGVSRNKISRIKRNFYLKITSFFFPNITIISKSLQEYLKIKQNNSYILPLGACTYSLKIKKNDYMKLFYIGTFNGRNLEITIQGFSLFLKNFKNKILCEYHIVGGGTLAEEEKLKRVINENKIEKEVYLYGYKSHEEIKELWDNCNIGVSFVPITDYYNVQPPTKTYEYLCNGMIVIATDTLENRRVINSNNGILVKDNVNDFYNGLIKIYYNLPNYSSVLIIEDSKKYYWENIVQTNFIPILEKISKRK